MADLDGSGAGTAEGSAAAPTTAAAGADESARDPFTSFGVTTEQDHGVEEAGETAYPEDLPIPPETDES